MLAGVVVLIVGVVILMNGAFPSDSGILTDTFKSPFFLFVLGAMALLMLGASLKRWKIWKNFGFLLTHIGVVLILGGSLWDFFEAKESKLRVTGLMPDAVVWQISNPDFDPNKPRKNEGGSMMMGEDPTNRMLIEPGFGIAVKKFEVERYPPDVALLFRRKVRPQTQRPQMTTKLLGYIKVTPKGLDLGKKLGKIPLTRVQTADGEWLPQVRLSQDYLLSAPRDEDFPPPRRYMLLQFVPKEVPKVYDYVFEKEYKITDEGVNPEHGLKAIPLDTLKDKAGNWLNNYRINDDFGLKIPVGNEKKYHGALRVWERKEGSDAHLYERGKFTDFDKWNTNNPAKYNGWRLYLSSYDRQNPEPRFVNIMMRKNPGMGLVMTGCYMVMCGVFGMYFLRKRKKAVTLPSPSTTKEEGEL